MTGSTPRSTHGAIPDPTPGAIPGRTPGARSGPTPGATPGATPDPTPDATSGPTPGATPGPTPDGTPGPTPGPRPDRTPDVTPSPTPGLRPDAPPDRTPDPTPGATSGPAPDVTPDPTPGPRPGATSDPAPDVTSGATPNPPPVPGPGPTPDVTSPLLSVQGLRVTFPGRRGASAARAVDGVDLDIRRGEIVALVGESGCGKTTLARSLLGLVEPSGGRVTFDGAPLAYSSRALKAYRRRAQLVLQDPSGSLNPRHTVYDIVAEGLRIHGRAGNERTAVAEALSRAGLRPPERFFLRYPHELSGGQRQRVVIAGALVLSPELLVADEPVASLDASVRGEILALLLRLRAELGLSALVVTHDLGLAWNIADRVAVMYLGRIVETGAVEQVLTAPRHPYTQALLSVLPEAPGIPVVLSGEPPDPSDIPGGCRFHVRCQVLGGGKAERAGVADACRGRDPGILDGSGESQVACHWARSAPRAVSPG